MAAQNTMSIVDDIYRIYQLNKDEIVQRVLIEEDVRIPWTELACLPTNARVHWIEDGWECYFSCLRNGEPVRPGTSYLPSSSVPTSSPVDEPVADLAAGLTNVMERCPFFIQTLSSYLVRAFSKDPDYLCSVLDVFYEGATLYTEGYMLALIDAFGEALAEKVGREVSDAVEAASRTSLAVVGKAQALIQKALDAEAAAPTDERVNSALIEATCTIAAIKNDLADTARAQAHTDAAHPAPCPDKSVPSYAARMLETLSGRERDVLAGVAQGLTNTEIADRLSLSPHTVRNHISHILQKTGLRNRSQLATLFAWEQALQNQAHR